MRVARISFRGTMIGVQRCLRSSLGRAYDGCSAVKFTQSSLDHSQSLPFPLTRPKTVCRSGARSLRMSSSRIVREEFRLGAWKGLAGEVGGQMDRVDETVSDAFELEVAEAFMKIATEKGLISICGFGSLLSERSARHTFPNLLNFRVAVLHGFRRIFAHVAPVFLERGIANVETKEMSSLSVEPFPGEAIVVTVFEINQSEVPSFIEREHEFRFLAVTIHSLQGERYANKAVICAKYSDEEYRRNRCQGDDDYYNRYGRFNIEQMWRNDILPCRVYLRHCVLAAKNLSEAAYNSFLDHTFLGDRTTTIRQHLVAHEEIMQELPPPLLRDRYGG